MTKENKRATREMQRFERWMLKKVKTIHYADNKKMNEAYARVYKNALT